ncbi:MAG: cyclic nucleotide-binding domain-containing protein [Chrysiogenetes bacterium]|nr:cyclic nucleotide-binding domain-containing protein [Chrysiogenetes bacterium]
MKSIADLVAEHPFFRDFDPEYQKLVAGCGKNVVFEAGEYLTREGEDANCFYLVRRGRISIEIHTPAGGAAVIQTAGEGEVVGVSWLFEPHRWNFDTRATETTHAMHFDTTCLKKKCEDDPRFGYLIMGKFSAVLMERLQATRMRLLDLYGYGKSN